METIRVTSMHECKSVYETAIENLRNDPSKWGGVGLLPSSEFDKKHHTVLHLMSTGQIKSFGSMMNLVGPMMVMMKILLIKKS